MLAHPFELAHRAAEVPRAGRDAGEGEVDELGAERVAAALRPLQRADVDGLEPQPLQGELQQRGDLQAGRLGRAGLLREPAGAQRVRGAGRVAAVAAAGVAGEVQQQSPDGVLDGAGRVRRGRRRGAGPANTWAARVMACRAGPISRPPLSASLSDMNPDPRL